jgi:hypothetical protein
VGRALAFLLPDLAGTEIASADEVVNAMTQQAEKKAVEPVVRMCSVLRNATVMDIVAAVISHLDNVRTVADSRTTMSSLSDDEARYVTAASELWDGLSEEDQRALWVAPSKGGILSTQHRYLLKI